MTLRVLSVASEAVPLVKTGGLADVAGALPAALAAAELKGGASGAELIAPDWLKNLYSLSFALLLGHILSDVIDLKLDRQSVKIAVPSFLVPFACGLAAAYWLLPTQPWLNSLAIGLVFAITAIPVLYLYLRHIDYPPAATRRLVQTAILIDLTCWTLFGLAQGSLHLSSLLLPLGLACVPVLLRMFGIRRPLTYSLGFFALLVLARRWRPATDAKQAEA